MPHATPSTAPRRTGQVTSSWKAIVVGLFVLALLLVVLFGSRAMDDAPAPTPAPAPAPAPAPEPTVLRLSGSDTIGLELAPKLVEAFLTNDKKAGPLQPGTTEDGAKTWTGTPQDGGRPIRIEIRVKTTGAGFTDLETGDADVAMASQKIPQEAVERLERAKRGDLTDAGHLFARDAIDVIVSAKNVRPVKALSAEQLRGVFTCAITDWAQLNFAPGHIEVLTHRGDSGTRASFEEKLKVDKQRACGAERPDNKALADAVALDANAISFVGHTFKGTDNEALDIYGDGLRRLGPTDTTISRGEYRLTRELYLYLPEIAGSTSPETARLAQEFVDFALVRGQPVVTDAKFYSPYPSQTPKPTPCGNDLPQTYCRRTEGYTQELYAVQFDSGKFVVDKAGQRNLDRLVERLTSGADVGRQVLILGFTDAVPAANNQRLSEQRAESVRDYLSSRSIDGVEVAGFGEQIPVAPNDTSENKEQNRRAEVWLR